MPDLTGTPTTLGIGTYDVNTDAPSGLGFNQAMGQIDTLLQARVSKPAGLAVGEVPVWNGTAFVRPTSQPIAVSALSPGSNGQQIITSGGVVTWGAGSSAPAPATTLPGSPTDGQQAILVDSTTTPTYAWLFQYDASITDANKWVFIGGVPILSFNGTASAGLASTAYADLTNNVSVTVPRAGVYQARYAAQMTRAAGLTAWLTPKKGATATADADGTSMGSNNGFMGREVVLTGLSASDVIKLQYRVSTSSATFESVSLAITPVRVA